MKLFLLLISVIAFVSCTNGDGDVHKRRIMEDPPEIDTVAVKKSL